MTARIIDGKTIAADLRGKVTDAVHRLLRDRGLVPGLAVVLVGDNPASEVYVRNKSKAVTEAGMRSFDQHLPASVSEAELLDLIARLNADATGERHPGAIAAAAADRCAEDHRRHRSGQGRRRIPSAQCRPARQRPAGAGAVHAARLRACWPRPCTPRSPAWRRW